MIAEVEYKTEETSQKLEKTEMKNLKDKKIRGPFSSFTSEFLLYFYSFQTQVIKVYLVIFSFSRKMDQNSGLGSKP